jgi:hypothetical protein
MVRVSGSIVFIGSAFSINRGNLPVGRDAVWFVIMLLDYIISSVSSCALAQNYPCHQPRPSIYSQSSTTPPAVAA